MGVTGFEKTVISSGKTAIGREGAAECAALCSDSDDRLSDLLANWPDLPEEIRAEIFAVIVRYLDTANRR